MQLIMIRQFISGVTGALMLALATINCMGQTSPQADAWETQWKSGLGCSVSAEHPHSGTTSLRQVLPADFARGHHQWTRVLPTKPGAVYTISGFYRYDGVQNAFVQFHFRYPSGEPMPFHDFRFSTPAIRGTQQEWTEFTYDVKAPAGSASVEIGLRLNSPGSIWWDDVQFKMKQAPADIQFSQASHPYDMSDSVGIVRMYEMDKITALNIQWVRHNINWSDVQKPGPGLWDQEYLNKQEELLRQASAKGLNVMLSLGYAPRWAARRNEGVSGGSVVAKDLKDWQQYVAVVVGRMHKYVHTYRIMNEVNHQWDTGAQPAEYAEFLKSGYQVIKAIDPQATVIMAGVSGTPGGYLQGLYDANAGGFMDIAACQSYVQGHKSPEEGNLVARLQAYRMVMASNNDNHPLWVTEFGYPAEPLSSITPMEQAAYSVRSHLLALSSGAGVTKFFFYPLKDTDGDTITQTGGLYDRQWQVKPIGRAVATLAEVINPVVEYTGSVNLGADSALYNRIFKTKNGQYVWALWRTRGSQALQLQFDKPAISITWDGMRSEPSRTLNITVNENPVYIAGDLEDKAAIANKNASFGFESLAAAQRTTVNWPWVASAPAEADWQAAPEASLRGKRQPSAGVIAKAKVIASPQALFIRMNIDDKSPAKNMATGFAAVWIQDSVEVFINRVPENAPAGFVTADCNQFIMTPGDNGRGARVYWAATGSKAVRKVIEDATVNVVIRPDQSGYALEFSIPWSAWTKAPAAGDSIGLDLLATVANERNERVETAACFGDLEDSTDASLWGIVRFTQKK